jgi:DNA-binding transcriptional ArsR family regulator
MDTRSPFEQIAELDRRIHEPTRLAILTALAACKSADFLALRRLTGLSKGNLSAHLMKLEEAGLVDIEKRFVGKKPNTLASLTKVGSQLLADYWQHLERLRAGAARWRTTPATRVGHQGDQELQLVALVRRSATLRRRRPGRVADALDRRLPVQVLDRGQAQELVVEPQRLTPGRPRRRLARRGIARLRRAPGVVLGDAGPGSVGLVPALLPGLLPVRAFSLAGIRGYRPAGWGRAGSRRRTLPLRLAAPRARRLRRRGAGRSAGRRAGRRHCAPGPAQDGQDPHHQHRERWTTRHDAALSLMANGLVRSLRMYQHRVMRRT